MPQSVHSRAVRKAAELAGGRQALADRLALPRPDIDAWIADERRPALAELLRVVEVILDESEDRQASAGSGSPRAGNG